MGKILPLPFCTKSGPGPCFSPYAAEKRPSALSFSFTQAENYGILIRKVFPGFSRESRTPERKGAYA